MLRTRSTRSRSGETQRIVLVTGGAGYIGSKLVPALLRKGRKVVVFDALWFGAAGLRSFAADGRLELVAADIRDGNAVQRVLERYRPSDVVHLAAISNDPSCELDPATTRSVNLDAVEALAELCQRYGVGRFLFASSASVYGIREGGDVGEEHPVRPLTLYAECKVRAEDRLRRMANGRFCPVFVRAGSVCGWSPRQRLDLVVNILTGQALAGGPIRVYGGSQFRAHIHIDDLVDFYLVLLEAPSERVRGQAFNVVAENTTVKDVAERVRARLGGHIAIEVTDVVDHRSYALSGRRAAEVLGWRPTRTIEDAIEDIATAWRGGRLPNLESPWYRNVQWMKAFPMLWVDASR